jgi:hypothetical protein
MTRDDDFIGQLEGYLEHYVGSTPLPEDVRYAIRAELPSIRQRPAWWRVRRFPEMNNIAKLGVAAAAVVVTAILGFNYLAAPNVGGPSPDDPTPTAEPTPMTTPTPIPATSAGLTPAAILETSMWGTYTSGQYGFSMGHPVGWNVEPADRAWDLDTDAADWLSPAMDDFTSPTGDVRVSAWSVPTTVDGFAPYSAVEEWVAEYCQRVGSQSCSGALDGALNLCVEVADCHPGLLLTSDDEVQAFFTGGFYDGEMVVVTLWRGESDPALEPYGGGRPLLEAFLSTMCVWPEDARPEPPPACSRQLGQ